VKLPLSLLLLSACAGPAEIEAESPPKENDGGDTQVNDREELASDSAELSIGDLLDLLFDRDDTGDSGPELFDDAVLVSHDLPSDLHTGATTAVTITLRNAGTTTWSTAGGYKLGWVDDGANPFLAPGADTRVYLAAGSSVAPGASATFTATLHAPAAPGGYAAQFRMVREGVTWFGDLARRTVVVAADAPDPDPQPGSCTFPIDIPEAAFTEYAGVREDTDPAVDAAVNAVMQELTGCGIGSACPITGYPGTTTEQICQGWFTAVEQKLRDRGLCAGQHETTSDEIAVSNTGCTGRWYGYHICNYGGPTVVWNPGARRGWWRISADYCR
jgi:hypothetical protein